jgi:two-component system KDP operon response regulator KdpE
MLRLGLGSPKDGRAATASLDHPPGEAASGDLYEISTPRRAICTSPLRRPPDRGAMKASGGASDGPRVLICDDEPHIIRALKVTLREAGFRSLPAATVAEALQVAALQHPDAAILDLVLPDGDGLDVCRALRTWSEMPIIVLSATGDEDRKILVLEAGADDYVTKPFSPRELIARLRAALRRARPEAGDPVLRLDDLEIDLSARIVRRGGEEVHLTPIEFELLRILVRNRGRLMTHRALLEQVWGPTHVDDLPTLRTCIGRLRHKIEPGDGVRHIRTTSGVGYRFAS